MAKIYAIFSFLDQSQRALGQCPQHPRHPRGFQEGNRDPQILTFRDPQMADADSARMAWSAVQHLS